MPYVAKMVNPQCVTFECTSIRLRADSCMYVAWPSLPKLTFEFNERV